MLIDRWMPRYQVLERHTRSVAADPDRAWQALRNVDLARSPVSVALFAARGLSFRRAAGSHGRRFRLDDFVRMGFVLLEEAPGEELVLGLVGRFWRPTGSLVRVGDARAFAAHDEPRQARAVLNIAVRPMSDGRRTEMSTETRVAVADPRSFRSFRRYWLVVRPFSGLIRREMLRLAAADAEAARAA